MLKSYVRKRFPDRAIWLVGLQNVLTSDWDSRLHPNASSQRCDSSQAKHVPLQIADQVVLTSPGAVALLGCFPDFASPAPGRARTDRKRRDSLAVGAWG